MRTLVGLVGVAASVAMAGLAWAEGLGDVAARESAAREAAERVNVASCPTDSIVPQLVFRPPLEYPAGVAADRVSGTVDLDVVVGADGSVRECRVVGGTADAHLVAVAKTQVSRRLYCPKFEDGLAVESHTTVRIRFQVGAGHP